MSDPLDFVFRANPDYVDRLFQQYQRDPSSVDERWAWVFAGYEFALNASGRAPAGESNPPGVFNLVHTYRDLGHLIAQTNPLDRAPKHHPLLELKACGLSTDDLDQVVEPGSFRGLARVPLNELIQALRRTYCHTLGVEFMHLCDQSQQDWLLERMEPVRNHPPLAPEQRRSILEQLIQAEGFERFLHAKYRGSKRFSLEGGEALIPLLDTLLEQGAALGVEEVVLGMSHRGRLNVLAHVLKKPYELILAEFEGLQENEDVKYHLGYSSDHRTRAGQKVHLSLSPNPSHLEAIDPVVLGIVRAKQQARGDGLKRRVIPILMHGDAAFTGQGIVYETLELSELEGFSTGGTVHVLINNQVGFTAAPEEVRSTPYPSDLAKILQAPVFHVNADDPEAVVWAAQLALEFRQAFRHDVVIDLVCYRRHGHNELDDPTFTQPVMYARIKEHPPVTVQYGQRLVDEGVIQPQDAERLRQAVRQALEKALERARVHRAQTALDGAFSGAWQGLGPAGSEWGARTRVKAPTLKKIARALCRWPEGFTPHPRIPKLFEQMRELVEREEDLHWAVGETLAYGTLLLEGVPVRLTGQDSARGTFSHRHAVLFDHRTGAPHVPLNHLAPDQAQIEVINSPLSEAGVLGFEYGMSSADPHRLVIWEAQYGDFANGAQVIIDQFIASGEAKWARQSGLVLLLPHGYEGQGPEHSSARLERFLQLCAENNLQVVNPTTPAQFFHVVRRQVHRPFRKPLVVMSPKSLLRHKGAVSSLSEFTQQDFQPVLADPRAPEPKAVERVLICSGRIYYALEAERARRGLEDRVALLRLEELYPFPAEALRAALARYAGARAVGWVQEEPQNQGAWSFVAPRLRRLLGPGQALSYHGRAAAASPATGSFKIHQQEEQALLEAALDLGARATAPERAQSGKP